MFKSNFRKSPSKSSFSHFQFENEWNAFNGLAGISRGNPFRQTGLNQCIQKTCPDSSDKICHRIVIISHIGRGCKLYCGELWVKSLLKGYKVVKLSFIPSSGRDENLLVVKLVSRTWQVIYHSMEIDTFGECYYCLDYDKTITKQIDLWKLLKKIENNASIWKILVPSSGSIGIGSYKNAKICTFYNKTN